MRARRHLAGKQEDTFGVVEPSAIMELYNSLTGSLASGSIFVVAIFMVIGGIVIMNIMLASVTERTREIGVRMALGATRQGILKMVLSGVLRWTTAGAVLGLLGAWFCSRLLESLLFEVRVHDPMMLGVALLVLLAAAFLAAWIPARRAMRVDPLVALRYE